jgi:hypothetical protein
LWIGAASRLISGARLSNFWSTRQAQRLAGGKALGELEANPQLNCYTGATYEKKLKAIFYAAVF